MSGWRRQTINWQRRRELLQREKHWVEAFDAMSHLPALRAAELVRGQAYLAVFNHRAGCMLHVGWRCTCRPHIKFYAEPLRASASLSAN
jgi:hypothetical protein